MVKLAFKSNFIISIKKILSIKKFDNCLFEGGNTHDFGNR